jgi:alpha-glucosidase
MERSSGGAQRLVFARGLLLTALIVCTIPVRAAIQTVGNVTNVTLTVDGTNGNTTANFWLDNGGEAAVTPVAADVVRVRYYFTSLWSKEEPMIAKQPSFWPALTNSVSFTDQGGTYLIQTPQLNVIVTKSPFKVDFQDPSGYYLLQDDHSEFDASYAYSGQSGWTSQDFKLKCLKKLTTNQAFFGLGEYGGALNRRGLELECWSEGTYNWSEFNNPEYMNPPFFYGVQPASGATPAFVYGIFFNNPCRPLFKFGTQFADKYSFEAGDGQLDYFFLGGGASHSMISVIDRYSELTGRPTLLPKWAFGYQLSRFSYLNQSWVQYLADAAVANNIPLDAVYLDIDYMNVNADNNPTAPNVLHQLTTDSNFTNPGGMVSYCANTGVKIVPLIEPLLETQDPLYNEANTDLHFIKDNGANTVVGNIYLGPMSWFDFTSTPMQAWWQNKIANWMSTFPFAGIWNDIDEPEGGDQIPSNGLLWCDGRYGLSTTDSRRQWSNEHNYFGLRCAATSYGALLAQNPNKRPFVLSRSGSCGLQRYAVSWSGDTAANWTYARTCIRFGTSAMISGAAWYGHDLGGFAGTVDGELLTRWHEWGALLPFFRNHSRKGDNVWPDGNQGREPWRFPDPYQSAMRSCIQFRYQLMPYLYTLAYNASQTGEPMNTPPVFKYYADQNTASLNDYEFMAGDYLLAAPVYNQGDTTRTVYLPYAPGVGWYHWWSNVRYSGGNTVTVSAPLGQLPLFVRSGAIIPMGPTMQSTSQFQPNYMDINCWPEGSSSLTLYEDEGEGWGYTNGVYASVTFNSSRTATNWDFTIGARQGSYQPGHTNYFIYVYNPSTVQDVQLNGAPLAQVTNLSTAAAGWMMTSDGKLGIKVADAGAAQAVHVDWGSNLGSSVPYGAMTVAGTFLNPQWNAAASNMVLVAADTWQFDATLANVTNFQFKFAANGSWTTNWGENNGSQTQFTVPLAGTGKLGGASNILANGTFNGTYRFTFNDQTLAYSVAPLLASPYAAMTVAGTLNNWNAALTNMLLVASSLWQYDTTFPAGTNVQFKFAANGTWTSNWGDSSQAQTNPPLAGAGQSYGSNITANITTAGTYRFTFNDQTLAYSLAPLQASPYANLTVVGTFNGWNPGLTNMLLVENRTWQYDAAFPAGTNVQFKFAANESWAANWGDSSQTQTNPPLVGTGQSFGANISANITANGVYRFTFDDLTLGYSLQLLPMVPPRLNGQLISSNQACSLTFTNFPGDRFTVLATTNLNLPLDAWTALGSATETAPGQFQFTDAQATASTARFYRVRSP